MTLLDISGTLLAGIKNWLAALTVFEVVGFTTSLLGVWLAARENKWTWPVSMVGTLFAIIVGYQVRLYADVSLNAFYFVTSAYGWYNWLYGSKAGKQEKEVTTTKPREWVFLFLFALLLTPVLGYYFDNFTDADLPYIDSAPAAFSLSAYWMLAQKKLENWLVWLVVDSVYVGIYIYKELYLFAVLYFVFLILATQGYFNWRKSYRAAIAT